MIEAAQTQDELLELIYLMRQEIFFGEGRRPADLGLRMPLSNVEAAHVKDAKDYGQLTVSEIAYRTGYSSVAHLSRQFKQVTGLTPSQYRAARPQRVPITSL